jgi:putative sterol carrier protein
MFRQQSSHGAYQASDPKESLDVTHQFLSAEWMDAVREIRAKYADQAAPVPYKVKLNQVITGVPFGEGEVHLSVDTTDGTMNMQEGHLDDAEVTLTTDYDTAKAIIVDQDQAAAMQAFMSGKIKVQGDMTKLMMMNATPPDDVAKQVAAEIKEATA